MEIEPGTWWLYMPPDDVSIAPIGYGVVIEVETSSTGQPYFGGFYFIGSCPDAKPNSHGAHEGSYETDPIIYRDLKLWDTEEFSLSDLRKLIEEGRVRLIGRIS